MNDANHEPENDLLDRATAALRNAPVFENPPQPIVAATIAAVNQRFTETEIQSPEIVRRDIERRQRMFRIARYGSLAAAVVLMAIGASVVLLSDRAASVAFGQVVENVKSAKSVSFTSIQKMSQQSPTLEFKFYLQAEQMRVELPGKQKAFDAGMPIVQATVANSRTRDVLEINYSTKTARKYKLDERTAKQFANPIDGFRDLTEKDAELIGEEELAGQKTQLYRIKKLHGLLGIKSELENNDSCKAWVDPKTGLPVKITLEASFSRDKENKGSLVFENFKWNEKLDKELFDPKIPDGFKVTEGNNGGNLEKSSATTVPFPFSLVVENLKKTTSVAFRFKHKIGDEPAVESQYYVQGAMMRFDVPGKQEGLDLKMPLSMTIIIDGKSKEEMQINYINKTASKNPMDKKSAEGFRSPADELCTLKDKEVEPAGDEVLLGRKTNVYRLNSVHGLIGIDEPVTGKLWVDAENGLPVQLTVSLADSRSDDKSNMSVSFDQFQWNEKLSDDLFKMAAPEGFPLSEGKAEESLGKNKGASRISFPFSLVLSNIAKATSVSLDAHYRRVEPGGLRNEALKIYFQRDFIRLETSFDSFDPKDTPDKVVAVDLKNRTGWEIDQLHKTYKTFPLDENAMKLCRKAMEKLAKLSDKDSELSDKQIEFVGDESLDGHKVQVVRLLPGEYPLQEWKINEGQVVKVWIDATIGLPLRIQGDFAELSGMKNVHALYDHLQWNQPIDPKLFQLEPPEGFKLQKE